MIHILTACSRPRNLRKVGLSIARSATEDLTWHVAYDLESKHVGGQALKNRLLDDIHDGWVYVLDDDNLLHDKLFKHLDGLAADVQALVVSQKREDGSKLTAAPENVRVGHIDIGQVVLRRSAIGAKRIPLTHNGDGQFLIDVLQGANVHFLDKILSYHNKLDA